MRKILPIMSFAVAALLAAAIPVSAHVYGGGNGGGQGGGQGAGDPQYSWSLTGLDGGGGLLQTVVDNGYTDITGISGTIDGYSVSLYDGSNNGGYNITTDGIFAYNNVLYTGKNSGSCYGGGPGGGFLDLCGLMVNLTKNGQTIEANLFLNAGGKYGYALLFSNGSGYWGNESGDSFNIPEPGTLALLGAGLVAAAGAAGAFRRRKLSSSSFAEAA